MFTQDPPAHALRTFSFRECCGLSHERQIIRVSWPGSLAGEGLRDSISGKFMRHQRSLLEPESVFVELELDPFQQIELVAADAEDGAGDAFDVSIRDLGNRAGLISNGLFSLEVPLGRHIWTSPPGFDAPGPIARMRVGDGPWRGHCFFDTRAAMTATRGDILENGLLRVLYRFHAEFAGGGFYTAHVTVDRGQCFAVIEEEFQTGSGDQLVWDFSGEDLPGEFYLLDSSAAYQTQPLHYHFDRRLTRLAGWTQQSQHFGFSDGYAIGFPGERREIAGFVALEGGSWRGGKLNHLEAWTRRWFPHDPSSRRDVPSEAKADAQPSPERIPGRGQGSCEPHFNLEGWIGQGRRQWALVLTTVDHIAPADPNGEPLAHFEDRPDRERYRRQQSLLRRIHTQRGMLPLQEMLEMPFAWEEEPATGSDFTYPHAVLSHHFKTEAAATDAGRELLEYLSARVYGFWEGSASAYTNPVVSRRLVPEMFRYEWLVGLGLFREEERELARALFSFLMYLFASENYYAGEASMLPLDSPDSLDPTLTGMANQNFYTDVINVFGAGAQIFWKHPRAGHWRKQFSERWRRQLEYHMFPTSGVWEESHTYYHHVLHTVLPTFLRRRADGVDDEFAHPLFQKLVSAELRQLTPRDAFFGDARHVVPFGDHGVEVERYRYLWREFAEAVALSNRELAGNLAWLYGEMRGAEPVAVSGQRPAWRNEYVQGLGVMFRGIDAGGRESLLALRSGQAWGHHHNDDGSLQFYAKGRALIVDAGFGGRSFGRKKIEALGHSRWTLKDLEPVNFLWRFNRGWITALDLEGPLAFATCHSPVFLVRGGGEPAVPLARPVMHSRSIVQISPTTYLVVDTADTDRDQAVIFHLPGEEAARRAEAGLVVENSGLWMRPVPEIAPPQLTVDYPRDPEEQRFVTTAVEFQTGRAPFSAFLVAALDEGETPPEIEATADGWWIRGCHGQALLQYESSGRVSVASGKVQRLLMAAI